MVAKYDAGGKYLWGTQIGTAADEVAYGVSTDATGSVYIAGSNSGPFGGNTYYGGYDMFLWKFLGDGTQSTTHSLGSTGDEVAKATATGNGSVFVVGGTTGNMGGRNMGGRDVVIARFQQ